MSHNRERLVTRPAPLAYESEGEVVAEQRRPAPTVTTEVIGPVEARKYLQANTHNRTVRDNVVRAYARGDPIFALRRVLVNNLAQSRKLDRWTLMALTIKAWNYKRRGQRITILSWKTDEGFPIIQ